MKKIDKECTCGGWNQHCFKCHGSGRISNLSEQVPGKFFTRGLVKAGDLSPEAIQEKAKNMVLNDRNKSNELKKNDAIYERRRRENEPPKNIDKGRPASQCNAFMFKWVNDTAAKCFCL
jgi:hypothetical protein